MKQRLLGAIVIGCLAIIFIPILLDGEGLSSPQITTDLPARPPIPEEPQVEPRRPVVLADTEDILLPEADANDTQPDAELADLPEAPSLDARGLPAAWSIRLASFAEKSNAENLVTRLLEKDYKGYSRPIATSLGNMTAVYVGPVVTQGEANALLSQVNREFELSGIVVQFSIEELDP